MGELGLVQNRNPAKHVRSLALDAGDDDRALVVLIVMRCFRVTGHRLARLDRRGRGGFVVAGCAAGSAACAAASAENGTTAIAVAARSARFMKVPIWWCNYPLGLMIYYRNERGMKCRSCSTSGGLS